MHLAFTTMDKEPLTNTYFATLLLTTMPQIPLQKIPPLFSFVYFQSFMRVAVAKTQLACHQSIRENLQLRIQFSDMQVLVILRLLFELLANMY